MKIKEKKLKTYTLDKIKDEIIGKPGSRVRDRYEVELSLDVLGELIRAIRLRRQMTQEQLGDLLGVQKAQISKLEKNTTNVSIGTMLRVFHALKTRVNLMVVL